MRNGDVLIMGKQVLPDGFVWTMLGNRKAVTSDRKACVSKVALVDTMVLNKEAIE